MGIEREIERLESALDQAREEGDYEEQRAIERELRELEHEAAERERWEEEGQQRGWI